jgi:hypothetical protein
MARAVLILAAIGCLGSLLAADDTRRENYSYGAGFFVHADGFLLTNQHVIEENKGSVWGQCEGQAPIVVDVPHSGKEEDFQLFLSLLDSDRFYGKFRDGVHKVDSSDLMRRMVKEELLKPIFDSFGAGLSRFTLLEFPKV